MREISIEEKGENDYRHEIMQSCWKFNPRERPDFTELRMKLGKALEKVNT